MWLLNTRTYRLHYFPTDHARPSYAILSHVWRNEEVTFTDIQDLERARRMAGFEKVSQSCAIALRNGYEWIWNDTCCIDKTSSAELSEAINSMFAWYRDAAVCFAYLYDAHPDSDISHPSSSFRQSRWFTRGWTLQELIAPRRLVFLDKHWRYIGFKSNLTGVLEELTGIGRAVLLHEVHLDDVSVAKRMSWAARRETTRVEDRAYSLMGIFNVNMPTIYGEGEKAFIRLQLEIIRQSPDQSIFAWGTPHDYPVFNTKFRSFADGYEGTSDDRGLLASSPEMFSESTEVESVPIDSLAQQLNVSPITFPEHYPTNYGIRLHLPLRTFPNSPFCFALLACRHKGNFVALLLRRTDRRDNLYYVGMHSIYQPLRASGHPFFRVFHLPGPVDSDNFTRFIRALHVTDLYIHSYNANPQRSRGSTSTTSESPPQASSSSLAAPPSVHHTPPKRWRFIFHGPLLRHLRDAYGFQPQSPKKHLPGWAPASGAWALSDSDKTALTLVLRPPAVRHGVVLFRGPGKEAFAIAIGVQPSGLVWCEVIIRDGVDDDDAATWSGTQSAAAERMWRAYGEIAKRPRSTSGPADWRNGSRVFSGREGRMVTMAFTRWLTDIQEGWGADTRTYNVDAQLGGPLKDALASRQNEYSIPTLGDLVGSALQVGLLTLVSGVVTYALASE